MYIYFGTGQSGRYDTNPMRNDRVIIMKQINKNNNKRRRLAANKSSKRQNTDNNGNVLISNVFSQGIPSTHLLLCYFMSDLKIVYYLFTS